MTSNKPYLIKALYEWIVDNGLTPYLQVQASYPGVQVPMDYAVNGKIVLDISPMACRGLYVGLDRIVFTAKFSGIAQQIFVLPQAVLAIYAQENHQGMTFSIEPVVESHVSLELGKTNTSREKAKPFLSIVKKKDNDLD